MQNTLQISFDYTFIGIFWPSRCQRPKVGGIHVFIMGRQVIAKSSDQSAFNIPTVTEYLSEQLKIL